MLLNKFKTIAIYLALFLVPMWIIFLVNYYLLGNALNQFGIIPRDFSALSLFKILFSWLFHVDYKHIVGNFAVLLPLLSLLVLLEDKPYKPLAFLIFFSGLFTWLFGFTGIHIGASGLVFALFGYIIFSALITKHYLYLLFMVIIIYQYTQTILIGLIPKEEISLAAHLGGLVASAITAYLFHRKNNG